MLFTGYTWSQFVFGTLVLLVLYYAYVGWRYYRPELRAWLSRRTAVPRSAAQASEPLVPPSLVFAPADSPAPAFSPGTAASHVFSAQAADNEAEARQSAAAKTAEATTEENSRIISNFDSLHQNVIDPVQGNQTDLPHTAGAPLTPAKLPPPGSDPEALPAEQELPVAPSALAHPAEADSLIGADDLVEALDCLAAGRAPESLHPALEGTALAARFAANKRRRSAEIDALFGEEE